MPFLCDKHVQDLLALAQMHRECGECGHVAAFDYCRSCDQFYWVHLPGCLMYEEHFGHRLTIVPFVEDHAASGLPYVVCPKCGMVSHNPNDVLHRYCGNCGKFHEDLISELAGPRRIVRCVEAEDGSWEVTLSCGHQAVFIVQPVTMELLACAQCIDTLMEKVRNANAR